MIEKVFVARFVARYAFVAFCRADSITHACQKEAALGD
jgi:hypothetical protein